MKFKALGTEEEDAACVELRDAKRHFKQENIADCLYNMFAAFQGFGPQLLHPEYTSWAWELIFKVLKPSISTGNSCSHAIRDLFSVLYVFGLSLTFWWRSHIL